MVKLKASTILEALISIAIISIVVVTLGQFLPFVKRNTFPYQKTQIELRIDSIFQKINQTKQVHPTKFKIQSIQYKISTIDTLRHTKIEKDPILIQIEAFDPNGTLKTSQRKYIYYAHQEKD